jgi:MFS family permease
MAFMLVNIVIMGDILFMPTINDVYQLFPNSGSIVNFAISGNYLMVVFASVLAGKLCGMFGQKNVIVVGSICALTGGVLLLAIENVFFMCAMRLLFSFGEGFCTVSCMSLINDLYTEDDKRRSMVGYFGAVRYTLGIGMNFLAGKLVAISMRAAYSGYWIILPVVVLEIFFLPNISPHRLKDKHNEEQKKSSVPEKKGFGSLYWGFTIALSLFLFASMFINFFVSVYVAENTLGTPVVAANANLIATIGSCIVGFSFGKIYRKIGKTIILLSYIGTAIVSFILMTVPTIAVLYVMAILRGGLMAIASTYCYSTVPSIVPKEKSKDAIAILAATYSFAIFISTHIVTLSMKLIGNGRYTPTIVVPVIICTAIFFVQLFLNKKQQKISQELGVS